MLWKSICGYEGLYAVSDKGQVKSLSRTTTDGKHIKPKIIQGGMYPNGYRFVSLRKNGKNETKMVHRLVAEAFIPNPENLPVVNHIDGNKENNSVSNLEWCTQRDNLKHAVVMGLVESQCKIRRKVTVKQGEHIILFDTMKDCCEFFGFKKSWLHNQIRKHGCAFSYGDYLIEVHGRGIDK